MDTGILARIIQDIQDDEAKFAFQATFQSVLAAATNQSQDSVQVEQTKLSDQLNQSRLSTYVKTDYEALEVLAVQGYFGLGSLVRLESMLSLAPLAAQDALAKYIADRDAAISKIEALRSSLSAFELKPRLLGNDEYEIGFSFPEEYKDIGKLNKALTDVNNFLNELSAAKKQEAFKISYVSNGTIEIFIHAGEQLARDFDLVSAHIVNICGFYHIAKGLAGQIEHYPPLRKKRMKADIDSQRNDEISASVDELIKSLKIKDDLDRERVKKLFIGLVYHIGEGVFAEVRAPEIKEPVKPPADAPEEETKAFDLKLAEYKTKLSIDKTNKEIYLLEQEDIKDTVKLLLPRIEEESNDNTDSPPKTTKD